MPTPYTGQRAIEAALVHQARMARNAELCSAPLIRCAGCGLTLPRDRFGRRQAGHEKRRGSCRACERQARKKG